MAQDLQVEGTVKESVIVLTVSFGPELLLERGARERLSNQLKDQYAKQLDSGGASTNSCVVNIQSEVAGSPLVRALFELYREVVGNKSGQVVVVGYPPDYIESLNSLGLTSLDGFRLALDEREAISRLKG